MRVWLSFSLFSFLMRGCFLCLSLFVDALRVLNDGARNDNEDVL